MVLLKSIIKCDNTSFTHYYLCPYLPLTTGPGNNSLSLLKFKQRTQPDLDAWIDQSARLLKSLPFSPDTIILRALRHDETTARPEFPTAVDLLGQTLATRLNCHYQPDLIYKSRTTLPNKYLTRHERRTQLLDVYHCTDPSSTPPAAPTNSIAPLTISSASPTPITPPATPTPLTSTSPITPFLIIDDILTTGSTMRAIIRALRQQHPSNPIRTFTLTRADYQQPGTVSAPHSANTV